MLPLTLRSSPSSALTRYNSGTASAARFDCTKPGRDSRDRIAQASFDHAPTAHACPESPARALPDAQHSCHKLAAPVVARALPALASPSPAAVFVAQQIRALAVPADLPIDELPLHELLRVRPACVHIPQVRRAVLRDQLEGRERLAAVPERRQVDEEDREHRQSRSS